MGSRGKINAILCTIKLNLQKLVDIRGYVLPTNLQNYTQKDLTEVKIFKKKFFFFWGGYFFSETTCIANVLLPG